MSGLEDRLRQQLPELATKMVESHAAGAGQPATRIWPRRRTGARRLIQLAAAVAVLAGAAGVVVTLLGDPPPDVITSTPPPSTTLPDEVPVAPTTTQPEPEPTPTTQPPTTTQPEPEPTPTTQPPTTTQPEPFIDAPCSSPAVVDQTLDALVADCEALWNFYRSQDFAALLDSRGWTWNHTTPLQDWVGVFIRDERVTGLHGLSFAPYWARLTHHLGDLSALEDLFDLCGFTGPIPVELGNLPNLRHIVIHDTPGLRQQPDRSHTPRAGKRHHP